MRSLGMLKIFFFTIVFFLCCHSSSEVLVSEIQDNIGSGNIVQSDVNEFFQRRMKNKLRKALVGSWIILHEDESNIYYGYPRFKGIFSSDRVVEKIYFLKKKELAEKLSIYKNFTGVELRAKILASIDSYRKQKKESSAFLLFSNNWTVVLNEDSIQVQAIVSEENSNTTKSKSKKYTILLNKNDLSLLKIQED